MNSKSKIDERHFHFNIPIIPIIYVIFKENMQINRLPLTLFLNNQIEGKIQDFSRHFAQICDLTMLLSENGLNKIADEIWHKDTAYSYKLELILITSFF